VLVAASTDGFTAGTAPIEQFPLKMQPLSIDQVGGLHVAVELGSLQELELLDGLDVPYDFP